MPCGGSTSVAHFPSSTSAAFFDELESPDLDMVEADVLVDEKRPQDYGYRESFCDDRQFSGKPVFEPY